MNEQDHRIHSPELAHHMGYAEYPYHELATHALQLGLDKKHEEYMQEAHEAGIAVLREHIQSAQHSLDHFQGKNEETDPTQNESSELFKGIPITKTDFYEFAREHDRGEDEITRSVAGRVWGTLEMVVGAQKNPAAYTGHIYSGDWSEKTHLMRLSAGRDIALDFGSLVSLFEGTTPRDWLDIKNFGETKYALLYAVIEHKKAEVLATAKEKQE